MENTAVKINRTNPTFAEYGPFMPPACEDEAFLKNQARKTEEAKCSLFAVYEATADHESNERFNSRQWLAYKAAEAVENMLLKEWAVYYDKRVEIATAAYLASKVTA